MTSLYYNDLPVFSVDKDFIEHLEEQGFTESIEFDELCLEWESWEQENCK
jgi:hypothetical protein